MGGDLSALAPPPAPTWGGLGGLGGEAYSSAVGFSENQREFPEHPWAPWPGQGLCYNEKTEVVFFFLEKGTMLSEKQSIS